uniref:Polysaccharide biosynthesis protein C-terminal domain-containing protein n=1 Tax=Phytophthora ramorum TaxID=164328 RepID=H3GN97_PHYRM
MFMNITAYSIGFGLTSALDTLCSQAYGAKRFGKIGLYFQAGLQIVGACLGPVFLLNWYSESFLLYMGQDPEVSRLAQIFSRWTLPGVPFVFLYELVRKVLQAQNIMKPLVAIAALGNVVNIVSGYFLTYHTSMGFEGVALSRSLGNMVLPLLLVPYFYYHCGVVIHTNFVSAASTQQHNNSPSQVGIVGLAQGSVGSLCGSAQPGPVEALLSLSTNPNSRSSPERGGFRSSNPVTSTKGWTSARERFYRSPSAEYAQLEDCGVLGCADPPTRRFDEICLRW